MFDNKSIDELINMLNYIKKNNYNFVKINEKTNNYKYLVKTKNKLEDKLKTLQSLYKPLSSLIRTRLLSGNDFSVIEIYPNKEYINTITEANRNKKYKYIDDMKFRIYDNSNEQKLLKKLGYDGSIPYPLLVLKGSKIKFRKE